jgi:NodT family efflux transporter outer membrane factor (OMF) lipoprotein
MVGPNYVKPPVAIPPQFKEEQYHQDWQPIKPREAVERGAWWTVFHDPKLNDLEAQLNRTNQNIVQAEANYRQALALVDQARAGLFPTLTGTASLFRQKQGGGTSTFISTTGGDTTTSSSVSDTTTSKSPTTSSYTSTLFATWEPDLWGLVRRTVEANVAVAQSNEALVAVTQLLEQSALAQYYFELRTLDRNQLLLDKTLDANKQVLAFVTHQYGSGVASRSDVLQAQVQVETAQSAAINNGILRGQYEHAIAVLMGLPPADLSLKPRGYSFVVPVIPVAVPSLWLERRPDIAAAERLVQTMSARIGVAVAAYYPNLTLTSNGSANAKSLYRLIHTPALGWSAGAQLAETLLEGGLRRANVNAAKEVYFAQVAAYRQTVLAAFQDVEDNLLALRLLTEQKQVQKLAARHAYEAQVLVTNQYRAGTVPLSNVLTAQITAYSAQKTLNDVQGLQMISVVGLIKALGGGWHTPN